MKKILSLAVLLLMPLMLTPTKAQALPLLSGTSSFTFPTHGTTSVDWAVYAAGTSPFGSAPLTDFVYSYTINGWTGSSGWVDLQINIPPGAVTTGSGFSTTGGTAAPVLSTSASQLRSQNGSVPSGTALTSPSQTSTAWWSSSQGPVMSDAILTTGLETVGGSSPIAVMGPSAPPPGVPEPQTWALLLALMGFTTWWLRRRQDDVPLETCIAA